MSDEPAGDDLLSRWLSGEGLEMLELIGRDAFDVIGILDRQLRIRHINWTGPSVTREEAIGRTVIDFTPPGYRDTALESYTKVLETGQGTRFESMVQEGGTVRIWDVRIGPIRSEGEILGLIAITNDVTEQRREHVDRDRFFSLSLDMLVVVGPDGCFKRVNPAFGKMLGCPASDLIGTPFRDLVHPEDHARSQQAFERILAGTPVMDFENRHREGTGEYRNFSWRATVDPITGDVYAVARDVTEQRAAEAQLRQAQKMEAIGQLAGGVAHDFNNLMQAVVGNVELARKCAPPTARLAERLSEIENAGLRASRLTKQLLAFSRRQPLHSMPIDVNKLIQGLLTIVRTLLPEHITVVPVLDPDLASVPADSSQVEQVLLNLCVNARDAMERGGQLTIETTNVVVDPHYCESRPWAKPGRYVLLSVTDTGVGMTQEVRERVFEPFFSTKGPQHGTGLGLSTVYGIVKQHNGMLRISSEPDKGTTFKVYFPAGACLPVDVGEKSEAIAPGGSETILVAEDEQSVRRVLVETLQHAGYRTLVAVNGLEAVQLLRDTREQVRLVLLDAVMPELSGPAAWEKMRHLRKDLRVLFISGHTDERYVGLLPRDVEPIQKPFREEELLSRIRSQLDA